MTRILDGREIAWKIHSEIASQTKSLQQAPGLAIVLATNDEGAAAYARMIKKTSEKVGVNAQILMLGEQTTQDEATDKIKELADDSSIHGIILQSPIANGIDIKKVRGLIPLEKDIDGANPLSIGRLYSNQEAFAPATAQAVIEILRQYSIETKGKNAVVVGRSQIIGKPVANMLLDLDATVTVCHSHTQNLAEHTSHADILVVAAGKAGLITEEYLNSSAQTVVIDVGTNFDETGKMIGDVDFNKVRDQVEAITPVPGGVGPVTTAILLKNTLIACQKQTGHDY